jgi:E3 ubiquitin-protein ligase MYCBP2
VAVPEAPPSLTGENGLIVHVVEARGLMNKDMFGGKSNPFVVLKLWDQEFVSHVIKNSLSPRWNQTFVFTADGFTQKRELNDLYAEELTVTLWDKDNLFKNGFLGMVKISIASLVDNQVRDSWYPLEKRSSKSRVKGNIRLWTHLTMPPPMTSTGISYYPHPTGFTSSRISATLDGASLTADSFFSKNKDTPTFAMTFTHTPHSTANVVTPPPSPPKLGTFIDDDDFLHLNNESDGDKGKGKGKENPTLSYLLSLPPSSPPPSSPYVDGFGEVVEDEDMIAILRLEEEEKRKKDEEEERLFREYLSSLQRCSVCGSDDNGDPLILACDHTFCRSCLAAHTRKLLKDKKHREVGCPTCDTAVGEWAIKRALSQAEYDALLNQSLQSFIDSGKDIFRCPTATCGAPIERVPHKDTPPSLKLDATAIAEQHREEHRFRCRSCATEFCAGCMVVPYHAGYTCEGYARYLKSKHCRFCAETLPAPTPADASGSSGAPNDVCKSEECVEKSKLSCKKYNPCGHPCGGVLDEQQCLPCLQCLGASSSSDQTADDFCNICWVESLGSAPSIRLKCGHIFHYTCIKSKLKKRWPAARITFGFSECPLCKDSIDHPALEEELKPIRDLKANVQQKALQRLEFEGLSKARELVDPTSKWHNNREGFSMDKYAYFMCHKCTHPYFAGQRRCDAGEDDKPFDPADLVCGGCSGSVLAAECPTHGKDFLEWKCQFCCTVSSWYCWGKTHFCNDCHTRQQKGDYLTKKPKSAIPMCPGPDKCALGIAHPHCEEFLLGCALCRNVRSF